MDYYIFVSLFAVLGVMYMIIGFIASRNITTTQDYFLAGRKLGLWSLSLTLIATHLGGGVIIGTCDAAYVSGMYGIFYTLGIALGLLVLACGFASKLRSFNVSTIAELLEKKYDSVFLRKIASILSILSMGGILIGLVVSSRRFMIGCGIDSDWILYIFWVFLIAYTVIGGLKAVVMTDSLQVAVIVAIFFGVFGYVVYEYSGSFSFPVETSFNMGISKFSGMIMVPILFSLVEQDLAQRFFAAKSRKVAFLSSIIAGSFLLIFSMIPVAFGILARNRGIEVPQGASVLMVMIRATTNNGVAAFVSCAVLAAIISTADSLLCAVSSNLAQDFSLGFLRRFSKLTISKWITLILGIVVVIAGTFFDDVLEIYIQSYALLVCAMFVPVLFCFFMDELKKGAALTAAFAGLVGFVVFKIHPIAVPREIASVLLSFVGYASYYVASSVLKKVRRK